MADKTGSQPYDRKVSFYSVNPIEKNLNFGRKD